MNIEIIGLDNIDNIANIIKKVRGTIKELDKSEINLGNSDKVNDDTISSEMNKIRQHILENL